MKMRVRNAAVLFVWRVNGKIHHHAPIYKIVQQKSPCKVDVLLHGKLVLQGNVKAVGKLCFLSAFGFFNRIPERFSVCILRRRMRWQQDFRTDYVALAGVVADLAVVFAVQLFPSTVGGRCHSGLPRTALDLSYMKME